MTLFNLECNNVVQQVKQKCCLYYLTLKIMSKLHILIKLKPKKLHKPFQFDFFFFKIAIKEKGKISAIPTMTIMTMISSYDRPRSHSGLFIRGICNAILQCSSLQCSCKYTSISFVVKPIDKVCVELKLAFALEGSHRMC